MGGDAERGFLSRWSLRKAEARREAAPETGAPAPPADAREGDAPEAGEAVGLRDEVEILAELGLPDPDRLEAGADFAQFMAARVPPAIRNRALRRLWRSDPKFAVLDGLVDHGDDFTDKSTVVPNLGTAYQVGLGILRRAGIDAPESAAEAGDDPVGSGETAAPPEVRAAAVEPSADPVEPPAPPAQVRDAGGDAGPIMRPQRMRFSVKEGAEPGDDGARRTRLSE